MRVHICKYVNFHLFLSFKANFFVEALVSISVESSLSLLSVIDRKRLQDIHGKNRKTVGVQL